MLQSSYRIYRLQRLLDLIISLAVVGGLMVTAIHSYGPTLDLARMTHIAGNPFIQKRLDAAVFYALEGQWPRDDSQAERYGLDWDPPALQSRDHDTIRQVEIENGAIHVTFAAGSGNTHATLRPAVPAGDRLGPVIWVCGNQRDPDQWHVFGSDRTDINAHHIPRALR